MYFVSICRFISGRNQSVRPNEKGFLAKPYFPVILPTMGGPRICPATCSRRGSYIISHMVHGSSMYFDGSYLVSMKAV